MKIYKDPQGMTDLEKFQAFFDEMGVIFDVASNGKWSNTPTDRSAILPEDWDWGEWIKTGYVMYVAQAIFHFDLSGKYTQVVSDEMGTVYRRINPETGDEL